MEPNKLSYTAELPEPVSQGQTEAYPAAQPETYSTPPQQTGQAALPIAQQQVADIGQFSSAPLNTQVQPTADSTLIADDADLIEKEWVLKAKAIVAQTVHDPNLQTKEIGKVKAEYLKKRYNKVLKVDENA